MIKLLNLMTLTTFALALVCNAYQGAEFGIYFFGMLCVYSVILTFCIKQSKKDGKYKKFFSFTEKMLKFVFILWGISFIIIEALIYVGSNNDVNVEFDTIIVLGAGINGDKPSGAFEERLDVALKYLEKYPDMQVITTGGYGTGEQYAESYVAKKYLTENGIDPDQIKTEEKSINTYQNIKYAKEILGEDYDGKVAVVSSDFHLFRGRLLLKEHGIEQAYGVGSKVPNEFLIHIYNIREYFSVMKHLIFER